MTMLLIGEKIAVSPDEFEFLTTRSSGPGGQNVNKRETKVTARFNVQESRSIDDETRALLLSKLASEISHEGWLAVMCQEHRTQGANKKAALERLLAHLEEALEVAAERRPTKIPESLLRRRAASKQLHKAKKVARRPVDVESEA